MGIKMYLICFADAYIDENILQHITMLGNHYLIIHNAVILASELSSSEIFEKLNLEPSTDNLIISEIVPQNTYGFAHANLWKFLGILKENKDNDGSTKN